jgi:hypothetical protein
LGTVEQLSIYDGILLSRVNLTLVLNLANVGAIAKNAAKRTIMEWRAAHLLACALPNLGP